MQNMVMSLCPSVYTEVTLQNIKLYKSVISHNFVSPRSTAKVIVSSVVPKSVSEIVMLKLGEIIKPVK